MEENEESNLDQQISDYCKKQSAKFENSKKDNLRKSAEVKKETTSNIPIAAITQEKTVLVIGDSMVKNIDHTKLERAARKKNSMPLV